jgi:hypothetical protein
MTVTLGVVPAPGTCGPTGERGAVDWTTLVATAAGAVIAFAGTILADRLRQRRESEQTRESRSRDLYVQFIASAGACHTRLRQIAESQGEHPDLDASTRAAFTETGSTRTGSDRGRLTLVTSAAAGVRGRSVQPLVLATFLAGLPVVPDVGETTDSQQAPGRVAALTCAGTTTFGPPRRGFRPWAPVIVGMQPEHRLRGDRGSWTERRAGEARSREERLRGRAADRLSGDPQGPDPGNAGEGRPPRRPFFDRAALGHGHGPAGRESGAAARARAAAVQCGVRTVVSPACTTCRAGLAAADRRRGGPGPRRVCGAS